MDERAERTPPGGAMGPPPPPSPGLGAAQPPQLPHPVHAPSPAPGIARAAGPFVPHVGRPALGQHGGSHAVPRPAGADRGGARFGAGVLLGAAAAAALIGAILGGLITGSAVAGAIADRDAAAASAAATEQPSPAPASLEAAIAAASPSVVRLDVTTAGRSEVGSAVILREDGVIVTNAHVVTLDGTVNDATVTATTADGRVWQTTPVGIDAYADLAVLRLDGASGLPAATLADPGEVRAGDVAVALGSPLGLTGSASRGIVSTTSRSIDVGSSAAPASEDPANPGRFDIPQPHPESSSVHLAVLQTDAAINPGNSGGALVNDRGELIGINVAIATTGKGRPQGGDASGSIGIGFAIPIEFANRVAGELLAGTSSPSHGAIGANVRNAANIDRGADRRAGAWIESLAPGGPAERAGLAAEDVITAVDATAVATANDLLAQVRARPAGKDVTLTIYRAGAELQVNVTLDAMG